MSATYPRVLVRMHPAQEQRNADDDGDDHRIAGNGLGRDGVLPARHDVDAVGPLEQVQQGHRGGDVKDALLSHHGLHQGNADEAGIAEGGGKILQTAALAEDQIG